MSGFIPASYHMGQCGRSTGMRRTAWILLLLPVLGFRPGRQVLEQDNSFSRDSYFREQVYAEHDWRSFNALPESGSPIDPENPDIHLLNAAIFYASNQVREIHGRKPLSFLPGLRDAAACHSVLMADFHFFSHHNPYQSKFSLPEKRLACFGVSSPSWGENISLHYGEEDLSYLDLARSIVQGWFDSPGHRRNLLDAGYRYLGCAAAIRIDKSWGEFSVRATQNFCGPTGLTQK